MMLLRFCLPRRKETAINTIVVILLMVGTFVALIRLNIVPPDAPDHVVQKLSRLANVDDGDSTSSSKLSLHMERKTRKAYEGDINVSRDGPGEKGTGVRLSGAEGKAGDESMKKWFMNVVASDKIRVDRTVRDVRNRECKSLMYDEKLPTASVVIIFHNEAWSPLIRTIHSVFLRSAPDLLHEIVLYDDASDRDELGAKLDEYVATTFEKKKVKLVRGKVRQGLIRARLVGARAATGDVLIFLDSHCEANHGWLEPLLQRIHDKRSAVLIPSIDVITDRDIGYYGGSGGSVGGFWWSLHFTWISPQAIHRLGRTSGVDPWP